MESAGVILNSKAQAEAERVQKDSQSKQPGDIVRKVLLSIAAQKSDADATSELFFSNGTSRSELNGIKAPQALSNLSVKQIDQLKMEEQEGVDDMVRLAVSVVKRLPNKADGEFLIAHVCLMKHDYPKAIKHYQSCLRFDREHVQAAKELE